MLLQYNKKLNNLIVIHIQLYNNMSDFEMEKELEYAFKKYNINDKTINKLFKIRKPCRHFYSYIETKELNERVNILLNFIDKYPTIKPFVYEYMLIIISFDTRNDENKKYCWRRIVELQNEWKLDECVNIILKYINKFTFLNITDLKNLFKYNQEEMCELIKKSTVKLMNFRNIMSVIDYLYNNKITFNPEEIKEILLNNQRYININKLKIYYNIDPNDEMCIDIVNGKYEKRLLPNLDDKGSELLKKYIFTYLNDIKIINNYVKYYNLQITDDCINIYCRSSQVDHKDNIYMWLILNGAKPDVVSICKMMNEYIYKNRSKISEIAKFTEFCMEN